MNVITTFARGVAVAVTTTAAAGAVVGLAAAAAPAPATATGSFPDLLALLATVALAGCAVWGWLSVVAVLAEAATGRVGRVRGVPGGVRRVVLALCGLTALVALAAPATAATPVGPVGPVGPVDPQPDDGATLAGLPFPDRATGPAARPPAPLPPSAPRGYTVRAGDSLWSIARATRPAATSGELAADVDRLYAANRAAIGPDPDLIRPGQRLAVPRSPR